jgi:Tfp pilus assembly protein PilO
MGEGLTLREVPLTLQLTGRYRHIGEFLAGLAEEPFAVAVRSLTMARAETSRTQVRAELLLMVYLADKK